VPRKAYDEATPKAASFAPAYYRQPQAGERPMAPAPGARGFAQGKAGGKAPAAKVPFKAGRGGLPPVAEVARLDFPDIQRATLSNGIPVIYARRDAVPLTRVAVSFDAGNAADPRARLGTQSLMLALLDEGTKTRDSIAIAEAQERLGAQIGASASMDRTVVGLSALTANLAPSLELLRTSSATPAFARPRSSGCVAAAAGPDLRRADPARGARNARAAELIYGARTPTECPSPAPAIPRSSPS
jgi:hypothetical protein